MILGIKPIVDFAFKKVFGSPEYSEALIGLMNAILRMDDPIVAVDILNPFSYQEFEDDKFVVLDIRAQDQNGNWYNVEMQIAVFVGMLQRLVFYASKLYFDQLRSGDTYASLRPAISICLLNHQIFRKSLQTHHHFKLTDQWSGRQIDFGIEVHTLELPKYNLDEATLSIASKLEQWVFLLLHAQKYEAARLRALLPADEFQRAITGLEVISSKTKDRTMYDQREQAQRDYEWALHGAKAEGLEQGLEQGIERGVLQGKIQLLQSLLGEPEAQSAELKLLSLTELDKIQAQLQQRLRTRDA